MKIYLIIVADGFIGVNFLKYILKKYEDIDVIVVDSLTVICQIELIKKFRLWLDRIKRIFENRKLKSSFFKVKIFRKEKMLDIIYIIRYFWFKVDEFISKIKNIELIL